MQFITKTYLVQNLSNFVATSVARSAMVEVEDFQTIFFITLRVPTMRFGGSFSTYLSFYSNQFGRGVNYSIQSPNSGK